MFHLLRSLVVLMAAVLGVSLAPWYGIVKGRRHPDKDTESFYYNSPIFFTFLVTVMWKLWRQVDWVEALGKEVFAVWAALITAMGVGWSAVMFFEHRLLWKKGPEALMAKVGGPDAKHRDLWELCYVAGRLMRGMFPKWTSSVGRFFGHPSMAFLAVMILALVISPVREDWLE